MTTAPSPGFAGLNDGPPPAPPGPPGSNVIDAPIDPGVEVEPELVEHLTDAILVEYKWIAHGIVRLTYNGVVSAEERKAVQDRLAPVPATAYSAEARATGKKPAVVQTDLTGPRVQLRQFLSGNLRGLLEFFGDGGFRAGIVALVEESRQVLNITSDIDDQSAASRVVLRSGGDGDRSIALFTAWIDSWGVLTARAGLRLTSGVARLLGIDGGIGTRTANSLGQFTVSHTCPGLPVVILGQIGQSGLYTVEIDSISFNDFLVRVRNADDRTPASGADVSFAWLAANISRSG